MVETCMIFAAGFGTRMGDLTKTTPKPLLKVGETTLLDHALEFARQGGIKAIVVNTHYLAEQIQTHLENSADVSVIHEAPEILETGGGLKNARQKFDLDTVFCLNSDMIWLGQNPFQKMRQLWDPAKMDALLLMLPRDRALLYEGAGDFVLDAEDRLSRGSKADDEKLVFSGLQIIKTEPLDAIEDHHFSLNVLWDKSIENDRLYGTCYGGEWIDVGRPGGLDYATSRIG